MIRKYTINPPFAHQPGDAYRRVGTSIEQVRAAAVIDTRLNVPSSPLVEPETIGGNQINAIYEERAVASKTVTNVSVGAGAIVIFSFSDGTQKEIPSHAAGVERAAEIDSDGALAEDLLIAKAYRHSQDGTDIDAIIGSTVTIDTNADTPIQYNPSQAMQ